jgi:hypothetical protein
MHRVMRRWRLAALPIVLGVALTAGSAMGHGDRRATDARGLVFTRADGTSFSFPKARVSCGKSRDGGKRKAIFVDSIPSPYGGQALHKSYFFVEGVLMDGAPKGKVRFPHPATFGHPSGAQLFVFDRDDPQAVDGNELSTDQEEASGKIVFHRARCRPRPRVAFTIHASLGSEFFGLPNLEVDGYFRGVGVP